jgi:tetratricopeptide (TPR) repeat protein
MDRVKMLEQMVAQQPEEPFPRYGLAMEYAKQERLEDAWAVFAELIEKNPDYIATYLMAGNLLVRMDSKDEAVEVYDKGLSAAKAAGDDHTVSELEAARAELV